MRNQRLFGPAVTLLAALAIGQHVAVGKVAGQPDQPAAKGDPALRKRAAEFVAAFDKGDAAAVAGFWTPDGDYVDQLGRQVKGRGEIQKLYEKAFAERKGATLSVAPTSGRMVTPDVAIEDGVTVVTPADGGPGTAARYTAVLVRKDDRWLLESVRESVAFPPSNAEHLEGLEWLIGDWAGEAEKGKSARASYSWAENQNFIVCSFATTLNGVPIVGGTQWIGWDASGKQVRSWTFYSEGGFGEGVWARDGDKWSAKTAATTADGKKVSVTSVVTRVDADHVTVQPTNLSVDGKAIPDAEPLKLKRLKQDRP
jgi:uncharacterized protein (TIGR02246 family)